MSPFLTMETAIMILALSTSPEPAASSFDARHWFALLDTVASLSPSTKEVARILLTEADAAGRAVIARQALMLLASLNLTTVKRSTSELEERGLIRRELRHEADGRCSRNAYHLTIPNDGGRP